MGRPGRRRATAEQRELAEGWLRRLGRPVTEEAVAALAPHVKVTGRPEALERQAFVRLVRLGQTPTAAAVRGEAQALADSAARRARLKAQALPDEELPSAGATAARIVQQYLAETGSAPGWVELGRRAGWPQQQTGSLIARLRRAGWLAFDSADGGLLRLGPLATAAAESEPEV